MSNKTSLKTKSAASSSEAVKNAAEPRFATLRNLDPAKLTTYIEQYEDGIFHYLAPILRKMEERDNTWKIAALKTRKAVSSRPWRCEPLPGYETDPAAKDQATILTKFYSRLTMSDIRTRNVKHAMRKLIESAMRSYNDGWSVHELVFTPRKDGSLTAEAIAVPLHLFRISNGMFQLDNNGNLTELEQGGWLTVQGDGVGIACAVAKMFKTISLADWLVYSGRCGHPGIHAKTSAQKGTQQWTDFKAAIAKFGKEWSAVTGLNDVIEKVDLSVAGQLPYPAMVELMDRAIAALQRGADLSTMSAGSGSGDGASLQGDESDLIMCDNCAMITDAFRSQIDSTVLAWHYGPDAEIMAGFSIETPQPDTVDRDIKIDAHLSGHGVKLSRKDALQRYQRTEADPSDKDDSSLVAPAAASIQQAEPIMATLESTSTPPVSSVTPAAESVADTALNGAQLSSLVELLSSAAAKKLPMESLLPILKASFPTIPEATLTQIVAPLRGFTPTSLPNEDGNPDATRLQNDDVALQNASKGDKATKTPSETPPPVEAILEGITEVLQKGMYEALLDAASKEAKKGTKE
jgi:hypothetical protein